MTATEATRVRLTHKVLLGHGGTVSTLLTRKTAEANGGLVLYPFNREALLAGPQQKLPATEVSTVTIFDDPPQHSDTEFATWSVAPVRAIARCQNSLVASMPTVTDHHVAIVDHDGP
ncbi:MAG: hypothetical protein AAF563_15345 [Pseudomonadota bacterium]